MIGYLNLPDANLMQPRRDVKAWACLARIQLMMPDYPYLRKAAVEILDIAFQRLALGGSTCILGIHCLVATTHIHYVPTHAVIACCTIGDFPRVNVCIFIVGHQPLYAAIQMYHVRVTHLLPATATFALGVGVPCTYFVRDHLTAFGSGCAVDYKEFHWVAH